MLNLTIRVVLSQNMSKWFHFRDHSDRSESIKILSPHLFLIKGNRSMLINKHISTFLAWNIGSIVGFRKLPVHLYIHLYIQRSFQIIIFGFESLGPWPSLLSGYIECSFNNLSRQHGTQKILKKMRNHWQSQLQKPLSILENSTNNSSSLTRYFIRHEP